jgi:hypothetical protein
MFRRRFPLSNVEATIIVDRRSTGTLTVSFVLVGLLSGACETKQLTQPSPSPSPSPSPAASPAPFVRNVSPALGTTAGGTPITITGTGFLSGAVVRLDGTATTATVTDSTTIHTTTLPHAVGLVDIVVTNPNGLSGTGRFTYMTLSSEPQTITGVSPTAGVTSGGTWVTIRGSGFNPGSTATIGGVQVGPFTHALVFRAPAHTAGPVDIVVTNPNGTSATSVGGYTYVLSESLDLNGNWEGFSGEHWEFPLRFTIENRRLVSLTCSGAPIIRFASPPSVSSGEFRLNDSHGRIDGKFLSDMSGEGSIAMGSCAVHWEATKLPPAPEQRIRR